MHRTARTCLSNARSSLIISPTNFGKRRFHVRTPEPSSPEIANLLSTFEELEPRPISLSTLLSYGSPVTPGSVLSSASYARSEIPRRLARNMRNLNKLPYICGTNPFISRTHSLYLNSFHALASFPEIVNADDNEAFSIQLERHVDMHGNDIPTMSKGFSECTRYMTPEAISSFLDEFITNRIGVRLIAEQHIALSRSLTDPHAREGQIGVVNLQCEPERMIRMCAQFVGSLCEATLGASPEIVIDGVVDAKFAYVSVHVEYIVTEILKNSYRATVEHHFAQHGTSSTAPIPPVTVTISPSEDYLSLRIRDEGGGIAPNSVSRIFSYAFTTAGRGGEDGYEVDESGGGPYAAQHIGGSAAIGGDSSGVGDGNLFGEITGKGLQTGMGTIAGLGYGLPLARLYAGYFGGKLELVTLDGHGTDVFIKLRRLDHGAMADI